MEEPLSQMDDKVELVLAQLVKAGSNLSKLHTIVFYLYLPDEVSARECAKMIYEKNPDDKIRVGLSAKPNTVLCEVTRIMLPEINAIKNAGRQFDEITKKLKGVYDGWQTAVEK